MNLPTINYRATQPSSYKALDKRASSRPVVRRSQTALLHVQPAAGRLWIIATLCSRLATMTDILNGRQSKWRRECPTSTEPRPTALSDSPRGRVVARFPDRESSDYYWGLRRELDVLGVNLLLRERGQAAQLPVPTHKVFEPTRRSQSRPTRRLIAFEVMTSVLAGLKTFTRTTHQSHRLIYRQLQSNVPRELQDVTIFSRRNRGQKIWIFF